MASAGVILLFVPLIRKIFADFSSKNCGFFYHRLIGILKDDNEFNVQAAGGELPAEGDADAAGQPGEEGRDVRRLQHGGT